MWKDPTLQPAKLRSSWEYGFWLGRSQTSNVHLIGTRVGIVVARTIRRLPTSFSSACSESGTDQLYTVGSSCTHILIETGFESGHLNSEFGRHKCSHIVILYSFSLARPNLAHPLLVLRFPFFFFFCRYFLFSFVFDWFLYFFSLVSRFLCVFFSFSCFFSMFISLQHPSLFFSTFSPLFSPLALPFLLPFLLHFIHSLFSTTIPLHTVFSTPPLSSLPLFSPPSPPPLSFYLSSPFTLPSPFSPLPFSHPFFSLLFLTPFSLSFFSPFCDPHAVQVVVSCVCGGTGP